MLRAEECYSTEEVATLLNTTREKVGWFRMYGLIPGMKTGKGYTFRASAINHFLELTEGADISNRQKVKAFAKRKGLVTLR
jgi:hypothetical protein